MGGSPSEFGFAPTTAAPPPSSRLSADEDAGVGGVLRGGGEAEVGEEPGQLVLGLVDVDGVAEAGEPADGQTGLVQIELPRVEVDHGRLVFDGVEALDGEAREPVGHEAEVAAARHRQSLPPDRG